MAEQPLTATHCASDLKLHLQLKENTEWQWCRFPGNNSIQLNEFHPLIINGGHYTPSSKVPPLVVIEVEPTRVIKIAPTKNKELIVAVLSKYPETIWCTYQGVIDYIATSTRMIVFKVQRQGLLIYPISKVYPLTFKTYKHIELTLRKFYFNSNILSPLGCPFFGVLFNGFTFPNPMNYLRYCINAISAFNSLTKTKAYCFRRYVMFYHCTILKDIRKIKYPEGYLRNILAHISAQKKTDCDIYTNLLYYVILFANSYDYVNKPLLAANGRLSKKCMWNNYKEIPQFSTIFAFQCISDYTENSKSFADLLPISNNGFICINEEVYNNIRWCQKWHSGIGALKYDEHGTSYFILKHVYSVQSAINQLNSIKSLYHIIYQHGVCWREYINDLFIHIAMAIRKDIKSIDGKVATSIIYYFMGILEINDMSNSYNLSLMNWERNLYFYIFDSLYLAYKFENYPLAIKVVGCQFNNEIDKLKLSFQQPTFIDLQNLQDINIVAVNNNYIKVLLKYLIFLEFHLHNNFIFRFKKEITIALKKFKKICKELNIRILKDEILINEFGFHEASSLVPDNFFSLSQIPAVSALYQLMPTLCSCCEYMTL